MFIDADTHVFECEETWEHFPPSLRHLVPRTIEFEKDHIPPWYLEGDHRMWFIDGQLYPRRLGRNIEITGTTLEKRELRDVPGRLADMDELGVAVQVIYPTLFVEEVTRKPELEVALCRSYNRWLAERCAGSGGRLRFVAMVPYTSMPDALSELAWAKDAGACGAFKRAFEAGGRPVSDPYFFDAYAAAADLDLPLCLHAATPWNPVSRFTTSVRVSMLGLAPNITAFQILVSSKIPRRFPGLRIGIIESGSFWITFVFSELEAGTGAAPPDRKKGPRWADLMRELGLFVTSEVHEDLPYLIANVGDSQLMIGTDYSHSDNFAVMQACGAVAANTELEPASRDRLTSENAARFYGLADVMVGARG